MPFPDVATDLLAAAGPPESPLSPLTRVTVRRVDPDTGATLQTVTGVIALKRKYRKDAAGTGGGGEVPAQTGSFRLWASTLGSLAAPLKERDEIVDADGVTWDVDAVSVEGFGGFVICDPCTKVRT